VDVRVAARHDQRVGRGQLALEARDVERARVAAGRADPVLVRPRPLVAHQHQYERALARRHLAMGGGQRGAGAGDPLARGLLADRQELGDLGVGEAGLEPHQQQEAVVRAEPRERLAGGDPLVGVGVVEGGRELLLEGDVVAHPAAPQLVDREVVGRPVEPRPHVTVAGVARSALPGARERLLAEVLGRAGVAHQTLQTPRERVAKLVVKRVEVHRY
jgi:hypothetical protein